MTKISAVLGASSSSFADKCIHFTCRRRRSSAACVARNLFNREERKRVLKLSVRKLKTIDDPETFLRRSVLVNNTMKKLHTEIRVEKDVQRSKALLLLPLSMPCSSFSTETKQCVNRSSGSLSTSRSSVSSIGDEDESILTVPHEQLDEREVEEDDLQSASALMKRSTNYCPTADLLQTDVNVNDDYVITTAATSQIMKSDKRSLYVASTSLTVGPHGGTGTIQFRRTADQVQLQTEEEHRGSADALWDELDSSREADSWFTYTDSIVNAASAWKPGASNVALQSSSTMGGHMGALCVPHHSSSETGRLSCGRASLFGELQSVVFNSVIASLET